MRVAAWVVVSWIRHTAQLIAHDFRFLLSSGCLRRAQKLLFCFHNLLVLESALPQVQGWSSMTR